MLIRNFRPGDAPLLRAVFHSSVHQLAARDYPAEQRQEVERLGVVLRNARMRKVLAPSAAPCHS